MYSHDQIEKYSSAVTLSDMEIFVFPDLMYSLVLANIMSPRLWRWRDDPWFAKQAKLSPYRKILRLKQYIIDHYDFNLDLDTWGLTTQDRERARFSGFIDEETLRQSNALFGYEGDKYYFDIDIRRHFGLDKYNDQVIPYWKTETVEAMDAFRFKSGYANGAGECVSLAALYAAALFVVCDIPLDQIYLMGTPLHSQNFIDIKDGILTNNRRILTKAMWFNGSEITAKAQRALRNERVTIVAHSSGHIHTIYPEATIDPERYAHFSERIRAFLRADIDMDIVVNFLRHHSEFQRCFQIIQPWHGHFRHLPLEVAFHYEHSSSNLVNPSTRDQLLQEVDDFQWSAEFIAGRTPLGKLEDFFKAHRVEWHNRDAQEKLLREFDCRNDKAPEILRALLDFIHVEPQLPVPKTFVKQEPVSIQPGMTREQIIARLASERERIPLADYAFYAARDLARSEWAPFLKAAIERNPVCIEASRDDSIEQIMARLDLMPNESIYEETRLAQPDEVWNYGRGDGVERALCLATILKHRHPARSLHLDIRPDRVTLSGGDHPVIWPSHKGLAHALPI